MQELTFDIRKIIVDDDNVQNQYENNLRRLRDDAKVVEKKYSKCISKEVTMDFDCFTVKVDGYIARATMFISFLFLGRKKC